MKEIVEKLDQIKKTISTMESCTGGYIASEITNIEGSSNILKFSAVTYSNEFKMKMGVPKDIIDTYTVYSMETAKAMAKAISDYTSSDYGVGITGKLNRVDEANPYGEDNMVFGCIYEKEKDNYHTFQVEATESSRKENKEKVKQEVKKILKDLLEEES